METKLLTAFFSLPLEIQIKQKYSYVGNNSLDQSRYDDLSGYPQRDLEDEIERLTKLKQ